jgi:ATP-dependent 26S proteasome regulatory subunit
MSLADDVDLEEYDMAKDDLSGADIKAICTEAGLMALRERRMRVNKADFTTAREKVCCLSLILTSPPAALTNADVLLLGAVPEERGHA